MTLRKVFVVLLILQNTSAWCVDVHPNADAIATETRAQTEFTLKAFVADYNRIEQVAYPLLRVGSPYCSDKRRWSIGASPRSSFQLSEEFRPHAAAVGLDSGLTFVTMLDNTPAAKAGIAIGDKVLALNGERTPAGNNSVNWFNQTVHTLRSKSTRITLTVQRRETVLDLPVEAHYVCNIALRYLLADPVNAFATINALAVTGGMLRFAPDDHELALVLGHELAHTLLRHSEEAVNQTRNDVAIGVLGVLFGRRVPIIVPPPRSAYNQDKERDADYLGIYLSAAAGYDTAQVADFWRRMAARAPATLKESHSASHPSAPERYLRLQAAAAEIDNKQKSGQPLLPDMEVLKTAYDGDLVLYEGRKRVVRSVAKPSIENGKTLPTFTQVPFVSDNGRVGYQKFLALKTRPRAFAISQSGAYSMARGANASADALELCNSHVRARNCFLYVVNDDLVYDTNALPPPRSSPAPVQIATSPSAPLLNAQLRSDHPPTGFAELEKVEAIPYVGSTCRELYRKWLTGWSPRAFAVGSAGNCGHSQGVRPPKPDLPTDPAQRALLACDRMGKGECKLYAIDDAVVWKP